MRSTLLRPLKRLLGHQGPFRRGRHIHLQARMATAFARAAATAATRQLDATNPHSWEFSGFSQHGEDGIVDYLCSRMTHANRYFVEIGAADGLQNCSAWLALARRFGGVMVEGNDTLRRHAAEVLREGRCHNVVAVQRMVNRDNVTALMKHCPYPDPDVLIIDIDGIDYYVLKQILAADVRPKLIVVEYNSVFGPEQAVTVPYDESFSRHATHPSLLYYGVSVAAWRALLEPLGYVFVTVESNGVNAFFIRPECFPEGFGDALQGTPFLENRSDKNGATAVSVDSGGDGIVPARDWPSQFALIQHLPLVEVPRGD